MADGLTFDLSGIEYAIREVEKVTGREAAKSLDKAGLSAIIGSSTGKGAIQLTEKADRAKILALPDAVLRGFVVKKLARLGQLKGKTAGEIIELAQKERRRRLRAVGYTAYVGWHKAILALGGRGIGSKKGVAAPGSTFEQYSAAQGYGKRANDGAVMQTEIANATPKGIELSEPIMQEALDNAGEDLEKYVDIWLEKAARKSGFD